jgi:hexulose-6-phosphate isomerase
LSTRWSLKIAQRAGEWPLVEIANADDDVPWGEVRQALADIGFAGWATAEVQGGDVAWLTEVRKQMERALLG